jgi:hypothetical protein
MSDVYKLQYNGRTIKYGNHDGFVGIEIETITILDLYPVGTLYKSVNADFDPNVTFGGTWVTTNFEGRTPVGFFDDTNINGGEETHTLSLNECPSHNHTFNRVTFGSYGGDNQTQNWNGYNSTNGTYDKISNGTLTPANSTNKASHNNIQKSLICKIWERIA